MVHRTLQVAITFIVMDAQRFDAKPLNETLGDVVAEQILSFLRREGELDPSFMAPDRHLVGMTMMAGEKDEVEGRCCAAAAGNPNSYSPVNPVSQHELLNAIEARLSIERKRR